MDYDTSNPVKTMAWILAVTFIPFIGMILYLVVGRNLKKKHYQLTNWRENFRKYGSPQYGFDKQESTLLMNETSPLEILLDKIGDLPLFPGNQVDFLTSGKEKMTRMFSDMEKATHHIHVLYYTIGDDETGMELQRMLLKKRKEGIAVRLVYDVVGSNQTHAKYFKTLMDGGVEVAAFSPANLSHFLQSINYRNHQKIVIIDGKIGYTGGMNIKDEYVKGLAWGVWTDLHIRVKGPAAQGFQSVFLRDWYYTTDEYLLNRKEFYPEIKSYEDNDIQVITTEPMDQYANIMRGMLSAIMNAKSYVYIETPYFVPTESMLTAIQTASMGGIDVRIVLPERSDNNKVQYAANSYVQQLLAAGVIVYRYKPGFIHSKVMVIDDKITITGSSNMDIRSFTLNFEMNVFIYNRQTALKAKEIILRDMNNSHRLDKIQWNKRSKMKKFREAFFRLFFTSFLNEIHS